VGRTAGQHVAVAWRVLPVRLLVAASVLLLLSACSTEGSAPLLARAPSPATPSPSNSGSLPTTPSPTAKPTAPWPITASGSRWRGYSGQKPTGTVVPTGAVSESTRTPDAIYGLADCASFLGTAYPTVSDNGGRTWRTAGPELYRAAAQGANAVEFIAASKAAVVLWDTSIVATGNYGRTWWRTYFAGSVRTVLAHNGKLTALVQGRRAPGRRLLQTVRYRSTDGGRRWRLLGQTAPTPPGPVGPHRSTHSGCG
jgi:hypothetical protein